MSERRAESLDRTASEAGDGMSEGRREEKADSPVRQIPSRIGPAEAEERNRLGNARRIRKTEMIWRTEQNHSMMQS